jgi:sorbitol-specific phosphotransferase system component IIA
VQRGLAVEEHEVAVAQVALDAVAELFGFGFVCLSFDGLLVWVFFGFGLNV